MAALMSSTWQPPWVAHEDMLERMHVAAVATPVTLLRET
jgi:hypothetical protein